MNRFVFLFCQRQIRLWWTGLIILVFLASLSLAEIPRLINYQGMLTQSGGTTPVPDDNYNLTFKIYGSLSGVDSLWWEYHSNVEVTNGLFNVMLGGISPIPDSVFADSLRYLGIKVGTDAELSPRIRLTSVGYSFRALRSDTADYAATGGTRDSDWNFLITDTADTTLMTGGAWGISRYGNTLYGNADSTHVNLGVACTTGASGQNYKYCTVGGGLINTASGYYATVGGGDHNTASGYGATIGGGYGNVARGLYQPTVAGGYGNIAEDGAFVGGGYDNIAGACASIGGGEKNRASGYIATIGGGTDNTASGDRSTVGGGSYNTASNWYATVGGGDHNTASGYAATIGGGYYNTASHEYATVGGGKSNTASHEHATIGGGSYNTASGWYATVGGGYYNTASGWFATVGGGYSNTASDTSATVSGGESNYATGEYATVPGGRSNTASGNYSFAAGRRAKANHNGTFVWADSTDANFTSTGDNQFLIRASGGVGIGTTSPDEQFEIEWVSDGTDVEIGRGTSDTDITFIALRSPNGTKWYIYPDDSGNLVVTGTHP